MPQLACHGVALIGFFAIFFGGSTASAFKEMRYAE
jgi:hypothetical protein